MAQAVNVNFRLDADDKKNMEQVCADLGLSMSAAFTIFAKKVGRERRIPFEVGLNSVPNLETLEALREVQLLKADPNKKTYGSFAEIVREMEND